MKKILLTLAVICMLCACKTEKHPATHFQWLNSRAGCISNDWQFQYQGEWYPATVPGNIHTDLLANGLIPDPYYGTNEDSVQWVADSVWTYRLLFDANCGEEKHIYENHWLVFEGLDTYAEVWLNGSILHSFDQDYTEYKLNNMFREWRFAISDLLKEKDNELVVKFFPSVPFEQSTAAQLPCQLPDNRVFTRKAQYESGWDWGPKLITCGIWKSVRIEHFSDLKLEDTYIYDVEPTLDSNGSWKTMVQLTVKSLVPTKRKCTVKVKVYDENGLCTKVEDNVRLEFDDNTVKIPVTIQHPRLWWPNGMGKQHLYTYVVKVMDNNKETEATVQHGLRTIDLVREPDSIGESFAFKVNGKPFYARGADWIPASSFVGTISTSPGDDIYFERLNDCAKVNMNMLRVWGGGIYESDAFYHYCDQLGLLVWQDFMFACNLYPANKAFLQNVKLEADHQLRRLRNYSCIAVLCGNNEVHNGLEDWGWQESLHYDDAINAKLHADYTALFEELLPKEVQEFMPGTPYVHSSPVYGWGHPECCTHGCSHYWGVWWGEQPFDVWKEKTGRFMSEYGFQAYPEMATIATFAPEEQWQLTSPILRNHQKHGRGIEIISKAMQEELGNAPAHNLADFTYQSQLVQAIGIRRAIDAHRIQHDRCSGTLTWQVNDCWPVASWSSIDYTGKWKALHYQFKEAFQNVTLCVDPQDHYLKNDIYAVNDSLKEVKAQIRWQLKSMDGLDLLPQPKTKTVTLPAFSSTKVLSLSVDDLPQIPEAKQVDYAILQLLVDNRVMAERVIFFTNVGNLRLLHGNINQSVKHHGDFSEITLTSKTLQYGVFISSDNPDVSYSDNYFILLPNQPKTVYALYEPEKMGTEVPNFSVKCFGR